MNKEIKAKWVAALRSGEYTQGTGQLRNTDNNFCCLGVLCNIHAQEHPEIAARQTFPEEYLYTSDLLPIDVCNWAGVELAAGDRVVINDELRVLSHHNDSGHTFAEIADAIEAQL